MSIRKTCIATVAILGCSWTTGQAQGIVPGGWSVQFSYQAFGGPGAVGGGSTGDGFSGQGAAISPFGFGVSPFGNGMSPFGQGFSPYGVGMARASDPNTLYGNIGAPAMTVNATDPLIHVIRHSVRGSRRR